MSAAKEKVAEAFQSFRAQKTKGLEAAGISTRSGRSGEKKVFPPRASYSGDVLVSPTLNNHPLRVSSLNNRYLISEGWRREPHPEQPPLTGILFRRAEPEC